HEDKDILVAVELRGGLDPFRQGEESFCQRRVNTYGILQKRVGKTCEDQGPRFSWCAQSSQIGQIFLHEIHAAIISRSMNSSMAPSSRRHAAASLLRATTSSGNLRSSRV